MPREPPADPQQGGHDHSRSHSALTRSDPEHLCDGVVSATAPRRPGGRNRHEQDLRRVGTSRPGHLGNGSGQGSAKGRGELGSTMVLESQDCRCQGVPVLSRGEDRQLCAAKHTHERIGTKFGPKRVTRFPAKGSSAHATEGGVIAGADGTFGRHGQVPEFLPGACPQKPGPEPPAQRPGAVSAVECCVLSHLPSMRHEAPHGNMPRVVCGRLPHHTGLWGTHPVLSRQRTRFAGPSPQRPTCSPHRRNSRSRPGHEWCVYLPPR